MNFQKNQAGSRSILSSFEHAAVKYATKPKHDFLKHPIGMGIAYDLIELEKQKGKDRVKWQWSDGHWDEKLREAKDAAAHKVVGKFIKSMIAEY